MITAATGYWMLLEFIPFRKMITITCKHYFIFVVKLVYSFYGDFWNNRAFLNLLCSNTPMTQHAYKIKGRQQLILIYPEFWDRLQIAALQNYWHLSSGNSLVISINSVWNPLKLIPTASGFADKYVVTNLIRIFVCVKGFLIMCHWTQIMSFWN